MIRFNSKLFEDIHVDGKLTLKAERKFKILRTFEMNIFHQEEFIISMSSLFCLRKTKFKINKNNTRFNINIISDSKIDFDGLLYEVKIEKLYPFKTKYAYVFIGKEKVGDIKFLYKVSNLSLEFTTLLDLKIDEDKLLKICILILWNTADLDGSE